MRLWFILHTHGFENLKPRKRSTKNDVTKRATHLLLWSLVSILSLTEPDGWRKTWSPPHSVLFYSTHILLHLENWEAKALADLGSHMTSYPSKSPTCALNTTYLVSSYLAAKAPNQLFCEQNAVSPNCWRHIKCFEWRNSEEIFAP